MRGTINPEKVINGKVGCPNCGKEIKINPGKCDCGVKLHIYKGKKGRIKNITWCGPNRK